MIKAVLFDLDGTLLDRDSSLKQFVMNQHDRLEVLHSADKAEYTARFIELDSKGYVWKDKVYLSLIKEYKISGITADELLTDYIMNFRYHCTPFPNLKELLELITSREIRLAMITNGFGDFQLGNVDALGISHYFEFIMVSELEGLRKPDEEIFRRALERLGVNASESIYVGDHPVNDVEASKRVGMKGIWKSDSYYEDKFDRDGVIHDLLDLKNYL
ncbi:haloacid dehalogenase [Paenibacillus lautus]|uniref:HAD family hydrolase n=1 Tax=Paenibacillus lautus TaxID=1401 RepID=UPI001B1F6E87|nr:HAD family hydrolase [Paenibacillus lautus]GIO97148.1 haloacid dehalogenase [Paenibacillus lautus]